MDNLCAVRMYSDSSFTDNCTAPLIRSPCEQCRLVLCMHSPTSFSRALLWKNNEILWMSSDFNHCLDTWTRQKSKEGPDFMWHLKTVSLHCARISWLSMFEVNMNRTDFRGTGTDYSDYYCIVLFIKQNKWVRGLDASVAKRLWTKLPPLDWLALLLNWLRGFCKSLWFTIIRELSKMLLLARCCHCLALRGPLPVVTVHGPWLWTRGDAYFCELMPSMVRIIRSLSSSSNLLLWDLDLGWEGQEDRFKHETQNKCDFMPCHFFSVALAHLSRLWKWYCPMGTSLKRRQTVHLLIITSLWISVCVIERQKAPQCTNSCVDLVLFRGHSISMV